MHQNFPHIVRLLLICNGHFRRHMSKTRRDLTHRIRSALGYRSRSFRQPAEPAPHGYGTTETAFQGEEQPLLPADGTTTVTATTPAPRRFYRPPSMLLTDETDMMVLNSHRVGKKAPIDRGIDLMVENSHRIGKEPVAAEYIPDWRRYVSEMSGTFILVFCGLAGGVSSFLSNGVGVCCCCCCCCCCHVCCHVCCHPSP